MTHIFFSSRALLSLENFLLSYTWGPDDINEMDGILLGQQLLHTPESMAFFCQSSAWQLEVGMGL